MQAVYTSMSEIYGPVFTIPREERTYNSSTLHRFFWRDTDENVRCRDHGHLVVSFRDNPDSSDQEAKPPSSAYIYSVPKEAFDIMKELAYNNESSEMTAGEWFNRELVHYVDQKDRHSDNLYIDKIKLGD